ncbi:MAG: iron chelate uptake ABC transporter family permease subunit, partial [Planctomycetota bacterium]
MGRSIRHLAVIACAACVLVAGSPALAEDAASPRIISFTPALTQIMFDMGLGDHVVGVTNWCVLPDGVSRPRVGDMFTISTELILSVRPDMILTQSDPSTQKFDAVRKLAPDLQIVHVPIERVADVPKAIEIIAEVTGRPETARTVLAHFEARIQRLRERVAGRESMRVLFVMGTDPPTAVADDTFTGDMIELAGCVNAGAEIPGSIRYRPTHMDAIVDLQPDVIICHIDNPTKVAEAREYWLQWRGLRAAETGRVYVVTDMDWFRPSTRLVDFADALADMVHRPTEGLEGTTTLWGARLLRWLAAALVGAALASGGMALQGLLRNPLAEPYILGVSSGAGVGVLLGIAATAWLAMPEWASTSSLAFAGALLTCLFVYLLAQRSGRLDPYTLILAGVIVNTFNGAVMLTIYLYVEPHRIPDFTYWAMGRLPEAVDIHLLITCAALIVVGWVVLMFHAAAANVLTLGDHVAATSGVPVGWLRIATFAAVGLMTAAAVALAGPIGFLGLIVPHICRMLFGPDQ